MLQLVWIAARSSLRDVFENVSLADLASRQPPRGRHLAHRRRGRLAAPLATLVRVRARYDGCSTRARSGRRALNERRADVSGNERALAWAAERLGSAVVEAVALSWGQHVDDAGAHHRRRRPGRAAADDQRTVAHPRRRADDPRARDPAAAGRHRRPGAALDRARRRRLAHRRGRAPDDAAPGRASTSTGPRTPTSRRWRARWPTSTPSGPPSGRGPTSRGRGRPSTSSPTGRANPRPGSGRSRSSTRTRRRTTARSCIATSLPATCCGPGDEITGVVDWVETSWGPAWLDVAHCRTNLAITHGTEVADRFAAAYQRLTGREPQPLLRRDGHRRLAASARTPLVRHRPRRARRLEEHLLSVL